MAAALWLSKVAVQLLSMLLPVQAGHGAISSHVIAQQSSAASNHAGGAEY